MTKFAKELLWLDEYLTLANTRISKTKKIKKITLITPKKGCLCRVQGQLTVLENNFYNMALYQVYTRVTHLQTNPIITLKKYTSIDLLCTFAHELAHLEYWDHTPKHKMLESELILIFMANLSLKGYISEEKEQEQKGINK